MSQKAFNQIAFEWLWYIMHHQKKYKPYPCPSMNTHLWKKYKGVLCCNKWTLEKLNVLHLFIQWSLTIERQDLPQVKWTWGTGHDFCPTEVLGFGINLSVLSFRLGPNAGHFLKKFHGWGFSERGHATSLTHSLFWRFACKWSNCNTCSRILVLLRCVLQYFVDNSCQDKW